jgi:hypothetical protein
MGNKGLVHQATAVWALSGTPMPNHPGELWVLLYTFGVTKLKHRAFLERYCSFAPGAGPRDPMMQITGVNTKHLSELRHLLKKISLRRLKKDVLDLPPILYGDMTVQPGPVSIKELFPGRDPEDVRRELRYQEDDVVDFFELEAMAGSCSTLRRYTGAQKMAPAAELVEEELDAGLYSKIVLFCVHQVVVEGLMTRLSRFNPVCVYGKTPAGKRQENIDRFQTDPTCAIFIANIKAAGTAITLTAADQVLFVEQEWVPGDNAQAAMRVHRIGQDRPVTARFLALWGSIDEKISAVLRRKTSEITAVLDSP